MEDLKEMFAQMMKFQMESQQKNEEKPLQLQKESYEGILKKRGKTTTTSERKRRKNLKKTRKNKNGSSLNYKNNKKYFLKL